MERWRGKWALITGASAGIGLALAAQLAAGGTNLILTARRLERLETLAGRLSAHHGVRIEVFPADLTLPPAPEELFAFTEERRIVVDLLVNNAGFGMLWTISHVRPHTTAGDGAGQYRGGRGLDAFVPAEDDRAPTG